MTLHNLQLAALVAVFALLFLARASKGRARPNPAGLSFPLKPLVIFARAVALPLYFMLFVYPLWISRESIPAWLLLLLLVATVFGLYQMPGTIRLTPTTLTQTFWLRASKAIPYAEILGIAASPNSAVTRVLGANRTSITHTFNHADSATFRTELVRLAPHVQTKPFRTGPPTRRP